MPDLTAKCTILAALFSYWSGACVFAQPLDSRCPATEQQTVLCTSGCPAYSAYLIGAKCAGKQDAVKIMYFVSMQIVNKVLT